MPLCLSLQSEASIMLFTGNCTWLTRWQGCILMTNYIHILINCIQWAIKYHPFLLHKNHSQLSSSQVAQKYERTNVWANTDKRRLYVARLRIVQWDLSDNQSVLSLRKNVFSGTPFSCTSQIIIHNSHVVMKQLTGYVKSMSCQNSTRQKFPSARLRHPANWSEK